MSAPEEVLAAVARGWSVIPVSADKRPLVKWKRYQTERADVEQVEAWAAGKQPAAWAVITGAVSGIVILDFDGAAGQQRLAAYGMNPHVRTGSGGHHVYFEHPGRQVGTLNGQAAHDLGKRFPGLDIRGDGGYACFHGRNGSGPYRLQRVDPEPWEAVPEPVRAFLGLAAEKEPRDPSELVADALRRVNGGEGRNNTGFWLACQLRDNGFSYADAERVLGEYATKAPASNAKGEPYTAQEARETVRSAYTKPARGAASTSGESASGGYEVTFTDTKPPKLKLPAVPGVEDTAGLCDWLTAVFNLNRAQPITTGRHEGLRGATGQIVLERRGAPRLRFEPAARINTPARIVEDLSWQTGPTDGAVHALKSEHCRQIAHVVRMLCGATKAITDEEETTALVVVFLAEAIAVEGHTLYGTTAQRFEAATALQREIDEHTGRPRGVVRYLIDTNTGEYVIRTQDLGDSARRQLGSGLARGFIDGRMEGLGWTKCPLDGHALSGRAGRTGPHARCNVYRGHLPVPQNEGSVTT